MVLSQEDPATMLEQFVQDVANLPAEIHHLLEEVQAKDNSLQESRSMIHTRDNSLQKFIKLNGSNVKNPKEEPYGKIIVTAYNRAQQLQDEKLALAEKAAVLLDRQIKRLDIKIRDLQADGSIPHDPSLPSLLQDSAGNLVPSAVPHSSGPSGVSTPLHPLSGNAPGGSASIAHAAIARMGGPPGAARTSSIAVAGGGGGSGGGGGKLLAVAGPSHPATSAPVAAMTLSHRHREGSVSSETKRRRTTGPAGSSAAAPSGAPRAGPAGSRAGSVGPKMGKKAPRAAGGPHDIRRKIGRGSVLKKAGVRGLGNKASPSSTGDEESALSEGDASGEDESTGRQGRHALADLLGPDADDDEGDNKKYCFCVNVSYGDMVACDNERCPYQWFHWACVGVTSEPLGEWLCPHCRKLPSEQRLLRKPE